MKKEELKLIVNLLFLSSSSPDSNDLFRLTFPHTIVEDGREKAQYDIDKGTLVVKLPKETKGEFFDGLDMLTQLLARKKPTKTGNPLIEVISSNQEVEEDGDDEEDFDWEQTVPDSDQPVLLGLTKAKYGFNKQYSDFFADLQEDLSEIVSITNPDEAPSDTWRSERTRIEDDKFDPEHYMADFMMDSEIKELLAFKTQATKDLRRKLALKKQRNAQIAQTAQASSATASVAAPPTLDMQDNKIGSTSTATQDPTSTQGAASTQDATDIAPPADPAHDATLIKDSATISDADAASTATTSNVVTIPDASATRNAAHDATHDATPSTDAGAATTSDTDAGAGALTTSDAGAMHEANTPHAPLANIKQPPPPASLTPASIVSTAFLTPASITTSSFLTSSSSSPASTPVIPITSATSTTSSSISTNTTPSSSSNSISKQKGDEEAVPFSDENKEVLMRLPNKECIQVSDIFLLLFLLSFKLFLSLCRRYNLKR